MTNSKVETTIRGVTYPSRRAAAKAHNVSVPAITQAARRGALDTVGLGPRGGAPGCPVQTPDGQSFPSISAAARAIGAPVQAVWLALERGRLAEFWERKAGNQIQQGGK